MKSKLVVAALLLLIWLPFVLAEHQATVSFKPNEMSISETKAITLVITNAGTSKHNIVKVEVDVPKDNKNVTFFDVKNLFELPAGWQSSVVVSEGRVSKIVFTALGVGIQPGDSASFILSSVTAPKNVGLYQFEWKTTDSKGDIKTGSAPLTVKLGPLSGFVISKVPKEVDVGKEFNVTVTAYTSADTVKADYTGTVVFSSTDAKAKFTPSTYSFKQEDNGRKQVTVVFNTPGNHTFTVKDQQTGIQATSQVVIVRPAVPRELSVIINEGAEETDSLLVTLSIEATNAKECRYSNDKIFWTAYEPYTESKEWRLEPCEGEKTVYVQCRNAYGESEVASDTIILKAPFTWSFQLIISVVALILSIIALIVASRKRSKKKEESS